MEKTCIKCGSVKPFSAENFRIGRNACRDCERARCRAYVRDQSDYLRRWKAKYPDRVEFYRGKQRDKQRARRIALLTVYGDGVLACACCGENYPEFLTLDHVHGGGTQHRKTMKGINLYRNLEARGYPDRDMYRVLCSNCNSALARADNTFESLREAVMAYRGARQSGQEGERDDRAV